MHDLYCRNIGLVAIVATLALGCMGQSGVLLPKQSPSTTVGDVFVAPHNAILAVGGTVQLSTTALTLTGDPLTSPDSIVYGYANAPDSLLVRVSPSGLLTGVGKTSVPAAINVMVFTAGGVQADQMLAQATQSAVPGATLSIQPIAPDTAKLATGTAKTITPVIRNATTGVSVAGAQLMYEVQSADVKRVGVFFNQIILNSAFNALRVRTGLFSQNAAVNQIIPRVGEGTAWIYARVNVYGTLLQDSVLYTFSYPYTGTVSTTKSNLSVNTTLNAGTSLPSGLSGSITIAPAGIITFTNGIAATDPLTVAYTFDNPAAATAPVVSPSTTGGSAGNVTVLTGGQSSRRQFMTAGTYHWTTVTAGGPAPWPGQTFTGTIYVK